MNKQTTWDKTLVAQNYDFGRPLDEKIILELFNKITNVFPLLSGAASKKLVLLEEEGQGEVHLPRLLDAGCGTGRITIPIARHFPNLQITGVDISSEMLAVLRRKLTKFKIKNYRVISGNLLNLPLSDNSFTVTIISSILHAIEDWRLAVDELIRVTKRYGHLLLISEQDDVTNLGLGKVKSANDKLLEKFWKKYAELHLKNDLGRLDKPQVGIKWQLGHPEVIQYLKEKKYIVEKKDITINWKKEYSISDFMKIIEGRPWSVMFTADDQKYHALISDMKNWLKEQNISPLASCISNNILKCEITKITK